VVGSVSHGIVHNREQLGGSEPSAKDAIKRARVNTIPCSFVDDGIATGCSILAAGAAIRRRKAARVVVAVPVAPALAAALSEGKQTKSSAWQSRNCFWLCHSGIRISARSAMKMCGRCSTEVPLRYPSLLEFVPTSA